MGKIVVVLFFFVGYTLEHSECTIFIFFFRESMPRKAPGTSVNQHHNRANYALVCNSLSR